MILNIIKINGLLFFLFIFLFQIKAQNNSCTSPPNCILNPNTAVSIGSPTSGDLYPNGNVQCYEWYVAYGTPTRQGNNGIWMWSYNGSSSGEGVYTCFNFQQGHTYKVCINIKTTDLPGVFGYINGTFYIQATNGNFTRPTNTDSQVIASWHMVDQSFTSYSFTFTANNNYSRLWLFPFMANAPAAGVGGQYEAVFNKVNVEEINGNIPTINVSKDTIRITDPPITPGHWSWSPSSLILSSNSDSSQIITGVCSPTAFTANYISDCPICSVYSLNDTVQGSSPDITITGSNSACAGQSITLTASGANTYLWQPGNLSGASITISPTSNITYTVTGTINNCVSTADYNITVYKNYSHIDSVTICNGKTYVLPNSNPVNESGTYISELKIIYGCDSVITTSLIVAPLKKENKELKICEGDSIFIAGKYRRQQGIYYDSLKSKYGCDSLISTIVLKVLTQQKPKTVDATVCKGDSIFVNGYYLKNNGIYIDTLTGYLGCDSIVFTNLTYSEVQVTNYELRICEEDSVLIFGKYQKQQGIYRDSIHIKNKCDSIVVAKLIIESCEFEIPNIFTPNNDGVNDYFVIKGIEQIPIRIIIFNRRGVKVFESNNYHNEWDGENLADGVYYYVVREKKTNKLYTGFVQILR